MAASRLNIPVKREDLRRTKTPFLIYLEFCASDARRGKAALDWTESRLKFGLLLD
ncbi:hypothetical protein E2C01_072075 [Portunus trituberculatus]|uniref:Uncharacterized protein n=1 Tax=Portunus trituberculatus TaxID=210409 RepID=A0A5B7I800_PORTR|nr:hypothetical protein [Portunus trituberculatus]